MRPGKPALFAGRTLLLAGLALVALLAMRCPARAQTAARLAGRPAATQQVGFDVYLPLHDSAGLDALLDDQQRPGSPLYHHWLTPEAFRARFGTDAATLARVIDTLRAAGLAVTRTGSGSLHVTGSVGAVEGAFATRLSIGQFPRGPNRLVAERPPALPDALARAGAVIAHFLPVTIMHRHTLVVARGVPDNRTGTTGAYWFDDLKQAYRFPAISVANGQGAAIGILMANDYRASDMTAYFSHEKLATPAFASVPIYGGSPFDGDASAEVELDMQQAGGMAPKAAIVLFNLPDLADSSILAGLTTIVETNLVDIVNMSFGGPEVQYGPAFNDGVNATAILGIYDNMFRQGNAQGITFVASSGDLGAYAVPKPACFAAGATSACGGYVRSVNMPASSPHVTGVGGTNLVTVHNATLASGYIAELASPDPLAEDIFYDTPAVGGYWGSGGGISTYFAQPTYQTGVSTLSTTMRMVPDIALHMGGCPEGAKLPCGKDRSSDMLMLDGQLVEVIGTSAAAPDFAGLLALKVQLSGGRLGNENPEIYALAAAQAAGATPPVFHTGIAGNNGLYKAAAGYNAVLGNGTPYANAFLGVANKTAAGAPQSPSNP